MIYILAIALLAMEEAEPIMLGVHTSRDACMIAAEEGNRRDVRLQHPALVEKQVEYVCLKLERTSV